MRSTARGLVAGVLLLALASCTVTPDGERRTPTPTPTPEEVREPVLRLPEAATTLLPDADAAARAAGTSAAFFEQAPIAVLAPVDDLVAQLDAAAAAVALGAPLLLAAPGTDGADASEDEPTATPTPGATEDPATDDPATDAPATAAPGPPLPPATQAELERLEVSAVLTVGAVSTSGADGPLEGVEVVPLPAAASERRDALRTTPLTAPAPSAAGQEVAAVAVLEPVTEPGEPGDDPLPDAAGEADDGRLPLTARAESPAGGLVLSTGDPLDLAAAATARAAGVPVVLAPGGDPGATSATVQQVAAAAPTHAVVLGTAFGDEQTVTWRVAAAATGVELPGGGQTLFPGRLLVAMYGTPGSGALGILGEQDLPGAIARAQALAAEYQALTETPVVPGFEMIVTIASAGAGDDGNYSNELPAASFVPWIEAARDAGIYVVLDLQPGRTDFLTQAKAYESLLTYPNVGLALDPEWRLEPDQVHLRQIGSVRIDEVNAVAEWLATLTRTRALPQKLFVLHQFSLRMIQGREALAPHPELAPLIHVDGQGSQGAKAGTWAALQQGAPPGVAWGWKNFIDEDSPMLTPAQTYQVRPLPDLVTYQ